MSAQSVKLRVTVFALHACLLAAGSVAGGQGERPEAVGDAGGGVRGERGRLGR